jgi:hypothetical protein
VNVPAAVSWGRSRLDVFARGTDPATGKANVLMHKWFDGSWHPWESLGGSLKSGPTAASWQEGRLDVFYSNASTALGHIWFDGRWHPHEQLGTQTVLGAPGAVSWGPGRIDVFARQTTGGSLQHKWFDGSWHNWESLGGHAQSAATVASYAPNRLDIFYRGPDNALKRKIFDGTWHSESSLGGSFVGSPAAVSWGGGRNDVFIRTSSGGVSHTSFVPSLSHDVLTQHNDQYRSGAMLKETILNINNVGPGTFGLVRRRSVVGKIYAQPLYAENVSIGGVNRKVVYIVTLENNVYAFDMNALGSAPLWQRTGNGSDFDAPPLNDGNLNFGAAKDPHIGIVSTPVIDRKSNTMYVVDAALIGGAKKYRLHALDWRTGADRVPPVTVGDFANDPQTGARVDFDPNIQHNRPGLLFANGLVYVAFGSSMDRNRYHGWVFAHRADTLARAAGYCTTSGARWAGGIWQSGNGLAADERGNVYFITGNGIGGAPPATPERQEESFVKLDGRTLRVLGQYTPHQEPLDAAGHNEFQRMENADTDLGSGGVLLVPGNDAAIGGGKPGKLYVLNRSLGENQAPFQAFIDTWLPNPPGDYIDNMDIGPNIHGTPVYWRTADPRISYVYAWSEKDELKAFPFDRNAFTINVPGTFGTGVFSQVHSMPGGVLSLSANGGLEDTAIVWAVVEETSGTCTCPPDECNPDFSATTCDALVYSVPGRFYAFEARTLHRLFSTPITRYSKTAPPTIANGKVILATGNDEFLVFGLL